VADRKAAHVRWWMGEPADDVRAVLAALERARAVVRDGQAWVASHATAAAAAAAAEPSPADELDQDGEVGAAAAGDQDEGAAGLAEPAVADGDAQELGQSPGPDMPPILFGDLPPADEAASGTAALAAPANTTGRGTGKTSPTPAALAPPTRFAGLPWLRTRLRPVVRWGCDAALTALLSRSRGGDAAVQWRAIPWRPRRWPGWPIACRRRRRAPTSTTPPCSETARIRFGKRSIPK